MAWFVTALHNQATLADRLRRFAAEAAADDDETWHISQRPLARGTTAFVSSTLRDAGTLAEAAKRLARAYDVVHAGGYNHVELRRDRLTYRIDDVSFPYEGAITSDRAQATMELVLVFVHAMLSLMTGRDMGDFLRTVHVRREPDRGMAIPPHDTLRFWTVPVRLASPCYRLDYDVEAAGLSIAPGFTGFDQEAVFAEAIRLIEGKAADGDVAARVRAALARGSQDQQQIAKALGVSVATLRRRLSDLGTSFRLLRAEVLNEKAHRLLATRWQSADVAEALGFADGRSFARAFRSWNGVSPACFRPATDVSENVPRI